jgi:hypothetical protein
MRNARRFMMLLGVVAALSAGTVIVATHAADQTTAPAAAQPAPPVKPAAAKPPAPGAPQVPEESATIRDDPTLVPDPKQSADNSVSFPNDI